MKHFKDPNTNRIYAYEEDGSQDSHIQPHLVPITVDEVHSLRDQSLQDIFNNKSYQDRRLSEYPSIGDQLDALFHAGVFPADMAARIQAVKDKYPKN